MKTARASSGETVKLLGRPSVKRWVLALCLGKESSGRSMSRSSTLHYAGRMDQMIQISGALLILAAFGGAQLGKMSTNSPVYLTLNLLGGAILTGVALIESDWGFLLLEVVWTLVSLWGLLRLLRGRTTLSD